MAARLVDMNRCVLLDRKKGFTSAHVRDAAISATSAHAKKNAEIIAMSMRRLPGTQGAVKVVEGVGLDGLHYNLLPPFRYDIAIGSSFVLDFLPWLVCLLLLSVTMSVSMVLFCSRRRQKLHYD